jgi:nonribosomal peptide synthetase DhbF
VSGNVEDVCELSPRPDACPPGLLQDAVLGHDPASVVVRSRGEQTGRLTGELTYGQLRARSSQLAHKLTAAGIGPGDIVALLLERGLDLPLAQLAVLKAGAAWTPLDPSHPPARLAFQVQDAAARLVLTTTSLAGLAPPGPGLWSLDDPALRAHLDTLPATGPDTSVQPAEPAYLIYTSGSTGTPKGVLVSHHSALAYCRNTIQVAGTAPGDRVAQVVNPAFDVTIFEIFATMLAGATLIAVPRETILEPAAFTAILLEEHVTMMWVPPAVLATLDPEQLAGSRLRSLFIGGEAFSAELVNRWSRPGLALHNSYGPTETTVVSIDYLCPTTPLTAPPPIGTPMPNHRAYVLDRRLRLVPVGVPGQLHIAGTGVAHGYLNRAGLTAERFLPDPYASQPGQRMYATGDIARRRPDGLLEYLGRADRQVKIRGQRVELGEIEHALSAHPRIRQCAVVLRHDILAACIVGDADPAQLREHLAARLPAYMIPAAFIPLPALPLNPNGKLDIRALPDPESLTATYTQPRTDTERWLAATWTELLGTSQVGAGDNFFGLGGNSLHGTQLIARIRDHLGIHLDPRHLFTSPVLEQLATHIDEGEKAAGDQAIVPVPRTGPLPCTHQQEGLWFMHQLNPASTTYHIPFALRLHGNLDIRALERAVQGLVTRHEALRTRFIEQAGLPRQVIDSPTAGTSLPVADVTEQDLTGWVTGQVREPFDLAAGPVFRAAVARLAPGEHALVLVVHHIVADGWSARILGQELSELYAGAGAGLPPLPVQPADHAVWQRGWLDEEQLEKELGFWRDTLAGLPTIDFPADRPRPARPTGAGWSTSRRLPRDLAAAARDYARDNQVSFLAVLQAALATVLHRYTGADDLPIGSIFGGRTRADLEPLVGFFANTLVLRTDTSGDPAFTELVARCHQAVLTATEHQDIPFSLVVDALQPERVTGRNPLFQISLTLQPASTTPGELTLGPVTAGPLQLGETAARFDISIEAIDTPGGHLELGIEYSTELYDPDRMERLLDHLTTVLTSALAAPATPIDDLEIMTPAERHRVLSDGNADADADSSAPGLLHDAVLGHDPGSVAVRSGGDQAAELTYAQLRSRSSQLGHALSAAGIGPGDVVALLLERGLDLPLAQLAVLKAGAAWMPLDPRNPPARLAFQVHDAATPLILTTTDLAHLAPPGTTAWNLDDPGLQEHLGSLPATGPHSDVQPGEPAYLIYTSGSTGTPKGVLVPHHSALTYCRNTNQAAGTAPGDRVAQVINPAFDVAIFEIFATLLAGATLITFSRETVLDPGVFTAALLEEQVTTMFLPPAVLGTLDPGPLAEAPLRCLFIGGEAFSAELVNRWSRPGLAVHNSYGPTETTVSSFDYLCPPTPLTTPPPIGAPMSNHRAYVLDAALRPAPVGVRGELYIAGIGVSHGYLNRPQLTAERFLPDPFAVQPGQRMYATGDIARRRPDGLLEYLGRADRQVQIRGQRVELGEIEHALSGCPGVRQCAVLLHRDTLAAYVVGDTDPGQLREHLAAQLPTYMIPATFISLPALPLNPNGKLDIHALPDPEPLAATYTEPRTDTERWLATAWAELLGTDRIGAGDNFFGLGGNSLHGTQLIARIRDHLGIHLDPRHLFTSPILEQLATRLDEGSEGDPVAGDGIVVTLQPHGTRPPLFFVHPVGGSVAQYVRLTRLLGEEQPFHALEDPGLHGQPLADELAERAKQYVAAIRRIQPEGPYQLGGWSLGGVLAFEMARQLAAGGADVASVIALDSGLPEQADDPLPYADIMAGFIRDVCGIAGVRPPEADPARLPSLDGLDGLDEGELENLALDLLDRSGLLPSGTRTEMRARMRVFAANTRAYVSHRPRPFSGRTVLIRAAGTVETDDSAAWRAVAPRLEVVTVPGDHYTLLQVPHLDALTAALRDSLHGEQKEGS